MKQEHGLWLMSGLALIAGIFWIVLALNPVTQSQLALETQVEAIINNINPGQLQKGKITDPIVIDPIEPPVICLLGAAHANSTFLNELQAKEMVLIDAIVAVEKSVQLGELGTVLDDKLANENRGRNELILHIKKGREFGMLQLFIHNPEAYSKVITNSQGAGGCHGWINDKLPHEHINDRIDIELPNMDIGQKDSLRKSIIQKLDGAYLAVETNTVI